VFQPDDASAVLQLFGVRDLQLLIVPGCKLMAAAAAALLGDSRPNGSSSSSSSFWDSAASPAELWREISGAINYITECTFYEYRFGCIERNGG
jgi:hypothetical protein